MSKAKLSIIAAMTDERVIGLKNGLPWKLPADMKWFRQHTLGKPIIMGRKTYESFGATPLPDRLNIVVTHDERYDAGQASLAHSIDEAIDLACSKPDTEEIMIIGGASFYEQTLPIVDRMYLTLVHTSIEGDAWFPSYDPKQWQVTFRQGCPADEKNQYAMTFVVLERDCS